MYAAAGGASLASRQARQRQRQNKQKQQQKNQKASVDLVPKPPQAKQFHNYTDPAGVGLPKLSRVERGTLKPPSTVGAHERRHSTSNYHLKESGSCHLSGKGRIRESPSISIPVVPQHLHQHHHHQHHQPLTPCTLVRENSSSTPQHHHHPPHPHSQSHQPHYVQSPSSGDTSTTYHQNQQYHQLPQIFIPEGEEGKLERRCSFVRQVEEMEKCQEGGLLDRCNHLCNFEINKQWDNNISFYTEYEKDVFGSLDYPFSECSQGRAAWQERERGRRCSISEEARQHRIKQTEAHHRWMKRNRIHDTSYGGGSEEEDFFSVYHQSAAANALLYVGLGTTAIGSVIFFVGTGEKGFKTLELRLIGPTLVACGLLCCLIRVLLCACPSTCFKRRKKTRLKSPDSCAHNSNRYPLAPRYHHHNQHHHSGSGGGVEDHPDLMMESANLLSKHQQHQQHLMQKKKVSIVPPNAPPNYSLPSTSTTEFKEFPMTPPQEQSATASQIVMDGQNTSSNVFLFNTTEEKVEVERFEFSVPQINLPIDGASTSNNNIGLSERHREDSIIELQTLDMQYDDVISVSSYESDDTSHHHNLQQLQQQQQRQQVDLKFSKNREPALSSVTNALEPVTDLTINQSMNDGEGNDIETCLSVVIERNDNNRDNRNENNTRCSSDDNNLTKTITIGSAASNSNSGCGDNSVNRNKTVSDNNKHSGIVLSPLQLGQ